MADDLPTEVSLAAQSQGFAPSDVIAASISDTEVVFVVRQGHKQRVPLADLPVGVRSDGSVSAETPAPDEPTAEVAVPIVEDDLAGSVAEPPAMKTRKKGR